MMENRVHTSSGLTVYAQSARAVGGRAEEASGTLDSALRTALRTLNSVSPR